MNIAVYCGSSSGNNPKFIESAKILGRWIGENGHTLVYGGASKGLMGAVAGAVIEAGGKVIGVIPDVAIIQARKHTGLTELIETKSMAERKSKMVELADAFVALPGGIGTLDEITEVMSLSSLEIIKGPVVLYDTDGYYRPLKAVLDSILNAEFGKREYFENVLLSEDIQEVGRFLCDGLDYEV
jgi:uncharacterized protein (TIGR00730 family)